MFEIPVFGEKLTDVNYILRNGVYVILSEKGKLALIKAPNGAYLLPGGEIEHEETHEQAIKRELIEEMGVTAEIGDFIGRADEYFHSTFRQKYYHNPAFIYDINFWKKTQEPLEDNNSVFWVTPSEALEKLKRGSHSWGVQQWLEKAKKAA